MENNKSYRVKANINSDTVINVQLRRDMDFLEILSLKLRQEDLYKLHTSNYGVIVGRVLASEAFGIPNVKLSIFVELTDEDAQNSDIFNLYPYESTSTQDRNGVRYNLLPNSSEDDCFRVVGTFPNKRLVLDENTYIEIFDKYWKYTTVTNKAGDYFIPHVPIGENRIHMDFDISDVGILSQRPRDMIYKGYNNTLFDNANQFKESTNLDNLTQIFSQNQSVYVYPFWGEEDLNEIAITRCDINVQYKFEPTCIFMGSIVSDSFSTAIGHNCKPYRTSGYNKSLVAGEGTIEMIRKTPDGFVEEFQIQGNQLIDGDGVFCYQIPMNLDYVQTDEYGNIVPTDNPKKGIPTRTSVRFRLSMNETENDGVSRHRAKYLIPNNPKLKISENKDDINGIVLDTKYSLESYYEFGTATNEDSYRDLYWNKVYSVKNYIPRIQISKKAQTKNYTGLRTANYSDTKNPIPFNKIRFNLSFSYRLSCIIATIVLLIINFINATIIAVWNTLIGFLCKLCFLGICPFKFLCKLMISCIEFPFLTDADEGDCQITCFFPGCDNGYSQDVTYKKHPDCDSLETDRKIMDEKIEQLLAEENESVNLDFYNDWLNGCLYLPLWYWKKRKKKKFFFGLFSRKAVNAFCNCDKKQKTKLMWPCAFSYDENYAITTDLGKYAEDKGRWHDKEYNRIGINYGFIKEKEVLGGLKAYYYAPAIRTNPLVKDDMNAAFLFATDIILLGSLNDCDLNGVPQLFKNLPSTTANVMPVNRDVEKQCDTDEDADIIQETTGMDFWTDPEDTNPSVDYGNGYFMNIGCSTLYTLPKTCVNVERLSELGVNLDQSFGEEIAAQNNISERQNVADGMITKTEIADNESRSMFATLNHNGLQVTALDKNIGYYFYKFKYLYPIEFDGRMQQYAPRYTQNANEGRPTTDALNRSYMLFRQGNNKFFYINENKNALGFPLYNNSYYFYFGMTEGKTAIDKFNTKFFAQCFQNKKNPFNMDITFENASWYTHTENCDDYDGEKLGSITIEFNSISTPYRYTITNSFGEIILENIECSSDTLHFNKFFDYIPNEEEGETNDTCVELLENKLPIKNDTYTITVTDSIGKSMSSLIEMENVSISASYTTQDLGTKFYENQTEKTEICENYDLAGSILFTNFYIDGKVYPINDKTFINPVDYDKNTGTFTLTNIEDEKLKISLQFKPTQVIKIKKDDKTDIFDKCICGYELNGNGFEIKIWIPQSYELIITQLPYVDGGCSDEILNTSTDNFTIQNGKHFDMLVDDVMLKFIMGKKYDNDKFAIKDNGDVNNARSDNFKGWFNINKEVYYKYDEFKEVNENEEYWIEVIDNIAYNNDGNLDESTFNNILEYKLQGLLDLSQSCFLTSLIYPAYTIGISGGRKPLLIKSMIPDYNAFDGQENLQDPLLMEEYIYDSDGTVECDMYHPTVVSWNYQYYYPDENRWINMYEKSEKYGINKLFNDSEHLGNYFAVFTDNGGMIEDADGNCLENQTVYNQAPISANPRVYEDICINGEVIDFEFNNGVYTSRNNFKPYFRTQFIDRRLDYEMVIMTPYNGDNLLPIQENEFDWSKGRVSGITINGIEMIYDKNHNIYGDGLEYNTIDNGINAEGNVIAPEINYNDDVDKKRFYSATIKSSSKTVDIVDSMWANGREPEYHYNIENPPSIEPFNVTQNNLTDVNGDFNEENYPIIRLFDVAHLPKGNTTKINIVSCSYDSQITYDSVTKEIQCTCGEGDEIELTVANDRTIQFTENSLETCVTNGWANVEYSLSGNNSGIFVGGEITCTFIVLDDNQTSQDVRVRVPRLAKIYDINDNPIRNIKIAQTVEDIDNIISSLDELVLISKPDNVEIREWNGWNYVMYNDGTSDIPLLDDDEEFGECIFGVYTSRRIIGNIHITKRITVDGAKFICPVLDKEYYNDSNQEFLQKKARVINTSNMFDTRPIYFTCTYANVERVLDESTDSEADTTVSGSVTLPPTGTDESGNPTGGGSTNINASADTTVTNYVETQVVTYQLNFSSEDSNKIFENLDDMEFSIKYIVNGTTYVLNGLTPTIISDTSIEFKILWNGNMKNVFLDGNIPTEFYIKAKTGFVYGLYFTMRGNNRNDTYMLK